MKLPRISPWLIVTVLCVSLSTLSFLRLLDRLKRIDAMREQSIAPIKDSDRVQLTVHNQDYKEDRERFAFKMGVMWTLIVQQTNERPMTVGQYWDVTWFRYTNSTKSK